jgi:hypothetical protein
MKFNSIIKFCAILNKRIYPKIVYQRFELRPISSKTFMKARRLALRPRSLIQAMNIELTRRTSYVDIGVKILT